MPEEKMLSKPLPPTSLVRTITASFDNSLMIYWSTGGESGPIPEEMLKAKQRLLATVEDAVYRPLPDIEWYAGRLEGENRWLQLENSLLKNQLGALEERVASLETSVTKERIVVLRDISREEARQQIRQLFSTERTLYYSEIAEELGLSLPLVVDVCKELRDAGEIAVDAGIHPAR